MKFFPQDITWTFCCKGMNFDLHNKRFNLDAWHVEFISFLLLKILDVLLECWKFSNWKNVRAIRIVSREEGYYFFFFLGFLRSFNGIWKVIRAIGYFCCFNDVFSSDCRFSLVFFSSRIVQMRLAKQNGIFLRQLRGWFDVKCRYLFESVALLHLSIQIFVPVLFIITSKNSEFVGFLSIVNCNLGFTCIKIVSKPLGLIN